MTDPAQYISGRTVEEQMNSLITYVDTRAAEVANAEVADEVAACQQAVTDSQSARDAAIAAKDTAVAAATDTVRKTPAAAQTITGYKLTTAAGLETTTMAASGNATVGGTLGVTGATTLGGLTAGTTTLGATAASSLAVSGAVAVTGGSNPSITKVSPNINNKDTGVQRGDNHASAAYRGVFYYDKNDKPLHTFGGVTGPGNMTGTFMSVYRNQSGNQQTTLNLIDDGTNAYASAPTPPASAPTNAIVTEAWCADTGGTLNNLVHKNSAESIAGIKTFTSPLRISISGAYSDFQRFTNVEGDGTNHVTLDRTLYFDKNGAWLSLDEIANTGTTNLLRKSWSLYRNGKNVALRMDVDSSGNGHLYFFDGTTDHTIV